MTARQLSIATLVLSLLLAGCGRKTDSLDLNIIAAGDPNPLSNVTTLRVTILNDQFATLDELEFARTDGGADLTGILGRRNIVRFQVEGVDSGGRVVARGGSAYVDLNLGGDRAVSVFVGSTNSFHRTVLSDGQFSDLPFSLAGHSVTRLRDGRVLVAGGAVLDTSGGITDISNRAFIYDPNSGSFEELASEMRNRRAFHTATLLKSLTAGGEQEVLLTGGITLINGTNLESTRVAEVFNPSTNSFSLRQFEMREARYGHCATLLISGNVLVSGGAVLASNQSISNRPRLEELLFEQVHSNADVFLFSANPVFATDVVGMNSPRSFHVCSRGSGALVLVAGGDDGVAVLDSADIYDPNGGPNGGFSAGATLSTPRVHASITKLGTGELLIAGGLGSANNPQSAIFRVERYTLGDSPPGESIEQSPTGNLLSARWRHQAILMGDNQRVLIVGGQGPTGSTLETAELIAAELDTVATGGTTQDARVHLGAARLLSGSILLVGGVSVPTAGGVTPLLTAEVYTPALDSD